MGSLAAASWPGVALLAMALAICAPFSLRAAWALTALRLGQAQAAGFGVDVARLRRWSLIRVGLLAAAAVSIVGVVGFVGLAAPHIARGLLGEDRLEVSPHPIMPSEDFSFVLHEVPGTYMMLGAKRTDVPEERQGDNHSPFVIFDDTVLGDQAALLAHLASERLRAEV